MLPNFKSATSEALLLGTATPWTVFVFSFSFGRKLKTHYGCQKMRRTANRVQVCAKLHFHIIVEGE